MQSDLNNSRELVLMFAYFYCVSLIIRSLPPCPVAVWAHLMMSYVSSIVTWYRGVSSAIFLFLMSFSTGPHWRTSYLWQHKTIEKRQVSPFHNTLPICFYSALLFSVCVRVWVRVCVCMRVCESTPNNHFDLMFIPHKCTQSISYSHQKSIDPSLLPTKLKYPPPPPTFFAKQNDPSPTP